jgi:predicted DNA-binding transcriptional regulator AlpA
MPHGSASQEGSRRAFSIPEFCSRYGVGRSTAYNEIKAGRLKIRKCGRRTIITDEDGEEWLRSLPRARTA